ncbi:MAG: ribosome hibernation-promoting factor, HPF/YfiA family [Gammaproteobacteria bacterium WSBS_2016_MAG_OTU1]
MQIEITGHHLEITDALRQHIGKRLERLNQHQDSPLDYVHVVLEITKNTHQCDIKTHHGHDEFIAQGNDDDMYTAIDRAASKIERQLQNAKGRKIARRTH